MIEVPDDPPLVRATLGHTSRGIGWVRKSLLIRGDPSRKHGQADKKGGIAATTAATRSQSGLFECGLTDGLTDKLTDNQ